MEPKKLEDILRVIELCRSVEKSSANPFDVDIREKISLLKKHLPEWHFLDELLLDSEAMLELARAMLAGNAEHVAACQTLERC